MGHGQHAGMHLSEEQGGEVKSEQCVFATGLVLAPFHRQVQLQMWDCRSVTSSSRRKKFKIPPASEKMYAN